MLIHHINEEFNEDNILPSEADKNKMDVHRLLFYFLAVLVESAQEKAV